MPTNPQLYNPHMPMCVGGVLNASERLICVVACQAIGHCDEGVMITKDGETFVAPTYFVPIDSLKTEPKEGMTRTEALELGQYTRRLSDDLVGHVTHSKGGCGEVLLMFDDRSYFKVAAEMGYESQAELEWQDLSLHDLLEFDLISQETWDTHTQEQQAIKAGDNLIRGRHHLRQAVNLVGNSAPGMLNELLTKGTK